MMRYLMLAVLLTIAAPITAQAKTQPSIWPVKHYVAADSVLATYYREFVSQYGRQFPSAAVTFGEFCYRLRTSDILTDRFKTMGMSAGQIHAILHDLEQTNFTENHGGLIRQKMLTIDLALETIQRSITQNHRAEFRREVIADIPPIVYSG